MCDGWNLDGFRIIIAIYLRNGLLDYCEASLSLLYYWEYSKKKIKQKKTQYYSKKKEFFYLLNISEKT